MGRFSPWAFVNQMENGKKLRNTGNIRDGGGGGGGGDSGKGRSHTNDIAPSPGQTCRG